MGAFSGLRQHNSIVQYRSQISSYVSHLLPDLRINGFRIISTGLAGLALAVSVFGTAVTIDEMYQASKDFYAFGQPDEPVKAAFEFAASDKIKHGEDYKAWLQLTKIASDLEDKIESIGNEAQIKGFYKSIDMISSLADSYKQKIIDDAKTRVDQKVHALRNAYLAIFLGFISLPYVMSLWARRRKDVLF